LNPPSRKPLHRRKLSTLATTTPNPSTGNPAPRSTGKPNTPDNPGSTTLLVGDGPDPGRSGRGWAGSRTDGRERPDGATQEYGRCLRGDRQVILTWVRKCDSLQFGHASSVRGERPATWETAGERGDFSEGRTAGERGECRREILGW